MNLIAGRAWLATISDGKHAEIGYEQARAATFFVSALTVTLPLAPIPAFPQRGKKHNTGYGD